MLWSRDFHISRMSFPPDWLCDSLSQLTGGAAANILTIKGQNSELYNAPTISNSKASILQHSAFFIVQLTHPYMTTGKTIALTRWNFVGRVISLLFNMLSKLVIVFLSRSVF